MHPSPSQEGDDSIKDVPTGSGGRSGSGGAAASCAGLTATCGPSSESCCKSLLVPRGTFYRSYNEVDFTDKSYPATVADFYLDKYEITVGRFRQFVNAGMGTQANPPAAAAGVHPLITGSRQRIIHFSSTQASRPLIPVRNVARFHAGLPPDHAQLSLDCRAARISGGGATFPHLGHARRWQAHHPRRRLEIGRKLPMEEGTGDHAGEE